jgi:hypothetical protein
MCADSIQYRIEEGVLARPVGDTVVLFHPQTERLLTLHDSGTRIWELLPECVNAAEIVNRLTEEFEGPEALIRQQVIEFLSQLEGERIVRRQG